MEDLSDRELERFLQENTAGKFFCGFTLSAPTPDHSYFSKLRRAIGTKRLADIFNILGDKMRARGLISDIFTFVDASQMVSKISLWNERDKAIKAGEERLNNINIGKHATDKDARVGCKGKDSYLTSLRMPYENIFSKMSKQVRYKGIAKVQFQAFMQAMVFNFKRLVTINAPPLFS